MQVLCDYCGKPINISSTGKMFVEFRRSNDVLNYLSPSNEVKKEKGGEKNENSPQSDSAKSKPAKEIL